MTVTVLYSENNYPDDSVERRIYGPDVRVVFPQKSSSLADLSDADCAAARWTPGINSAAARANGQSHLLMVSPSIGTAANARQNHGTDHKVRRVIADRMRRQSRDQTHQFGSVTIPDHSAILAGLYDSATVSTVTMET